MLLALLVGLTLTLVCQGHIQGNEHIGPHLTFLGELDHDQYGHNPDTHGASPNDGLGSGLASLTDMLGMDMSGMDMAGMAISASEQLAVLITASADTSSTLGTLPNSQVLT